GIRDFHVTGVQTCALPICYVDDRKLPRAGRLDALLGRAFLVDIDCAKYFVSLEDRAEGLLECFLIDDAAQSPAPSDLVRAVRGKIGRASCRERGLMSVGPG